MEGIWLVAFIVLWVIVLVLAAVCLALIRLLDQVSRRLAQVLDRGPKFGTALADVLRRQQGGAAPLLDFPRERAMLLFLVPRTGPTAVNLLQHARKLQDQHKDQYETVVLGTGTDGDLGKQFTEALAPLGLSWGIAPAVARALRVEDDLFAVWLDRDGVVRARGPIERPEHLDAVVKGGLPPHG